MISALANPFKFLPSIKSETSADSHTKETYIDLYMSRLKVGNDIFRNLEESEKIILKDMEERESFTELVNWRGIALERIRRHYLKQGVNPKVSINSSG
jgi:hypothetical protein